MYKSPQRKDLELAALLTGNTVTYEYSNLSIFSSIQKPKEGDRWYNSRYKEYYVFRALKGNWGKCKATTTRGNIPEWLVVTSKEFFNLGT